MSEKAIIIGGERLPREKEIALNAQIEKYAGSYVGMPLYKISWSADDNKGLARRHIVGCPKVNPFDWDCLCPLQNPNDLPVCFHENQMCYHILSWEPPSMSLLSFEEQMNEDLSRGTYACIGVHFINEETGKPVDPTAGVIELMVPALKELREMSNANLHGAKATVDRMRLDKINAAQEKEQRREAAFDADADDILRDSAPGFDGQPHSSMAGEKRKQSSDITLSEIERSRAAEGEP